MIVTVFRSRLNPGIQDDYHPMAKRMSELARTMSGYISHNGFVAEDGERVTIVEFEDEASLREWKIHPEHREAKKFGFTTFFGAFKYQICEVLQSRDWESKASMK